MDSVTRANAAGDVPNETTLEHVTFKCRFLRQYAVLGDISQFVCNQLFKIIVN